MAPPVASGGQSQVCDICSGILWFNMYPEDVGAIPHHKSRKALEASAEQCILCRMILRAAISNYQTVDPSYNHWLEYLTLTVQDETEVKDVLCTRELGAHRPEHNSTARSPMVMLTPVGRDFIEGLGQESSESVPVLTPTRDFESKTESEKAIGFPNLENLGIHDPTENLPVWVYGNFWEGSVPKTTGRPIQTVLMGIGARFGTSHKSTGAFKCRQGEMSLRGSAIRICTTDGTSNLLLWESMHAYSDKDSPMFSHIPGRLRELQSNSDLAYRRLATWLKNCMDTHPNCNVSRSDPKLPTRVIDVSKTDRTVALIESQGGTGKYIALSHTWGKSPRLTATKKTVDDLKGGVAVSFLPKTFQDAIEITRRLGIKYLWIDCLCIIQDDPQDWEREAAAMTSVYRNSYITISASASSDSHSGCFPSRLKDSYVSPSTRSLGYKTPREATGPNSYTSQYEHHSRPGVLNRIHLFEEWLPGSLSVEPQKSLVGSFGKTVDPIADQPLSSRGWTLQERLLAPRVVHYAEDQMYFECETEMASECGFKFPNTNFSLNHCISAQLIAFDQHGTQKEGGVSFIVGQPVTGKGSLRSRGGWLSLVEDYSRRSLSVAQDKLSAIAGVARVLAEETGDYYIAGVWASHLMEDIFWRVYTHEEEMEDEGDNWRSRPVLGRRIGNATRPSEYRAPSWSWASVEAPIKFIPLTYSKLVARPIHCYTTPSGADNYGRVQDGFIDIEVKVDPNHPSQKLKI